MDLKKIATLSLSKTTENGRSGFVQVRGARENNLKNVDVLIPRHAFVVFTGIPISDCEEPDCETTNTMN